MRQLADGQLVGGAFEVLQVEVDRVLPEESCEGVGCAGVADLGQQSVLTQGPPSILKMARL